MKTAKHSGLRAHRANPLYIRSLFSKIGFDKPGIAGKYRARFQPRGAIAQLGERYNGIVEVIGSIPFSSTTFSAL